MSDIDRVKAQIVQKAADGIGAAELRRRVMLESAYLDEAEVQTIILALQEEGRLCGHEVEGEWMYTSIDKNDPSWAALEYSPQFAEQIIAASCEEFEEIDVDDLIKQLDVMIAQARSRQTGTK